MARKRNRNEFLIIDTHMHLYHSPDAGRGMRKDTTVPEAIKPGYETNSLGTIPEALAVMDEGNIVQAWALGGLPVNAMWQAKASKLPKDLSPAARAEAEQEIDRFVSDRIIRQNRWRTSVARQNPRFVPWIYVDPLMGPDLMRQEIRECVLKHGAKGVGEVSADLTGRTWEGVYANDPILDPIWETCVELNVYVLPHFGPSHPHPKTGKPTRNTDAELYDDVLERFPDLKIVLLHMNTTYDKRWPELYEYSRQQGMAFAARHPEVVCDMGSNIGYGVPLDDVIEVVRTVGVERVIWGSDYLWINPVAEIEALLDSDLTNEELRKVLGENAVRIFDLKV